MVKQNDLRPEWLDFQVYRRVKIEMEPIESVAESMRFRPEQVARWIEQITLFLLTTAQANDTMSPAQEKRFALQLCAERMDRLVDLSLRAFSNSQGERTVWRHRSADKTAVTVTSPGDQRYLTVAAKLMEMMRDLPPPRLSAAFVSAEDPDGGDEHATFAAAALHLSPAEAAEIRRRYELGEQDGDEAVAASTQAAKQEENHPGRAYSDPVAAQADHDDEDDGKRAATPEEIAHYIQLIRDKQAAKDAAMRPVQPDSQGGAQSTLPRDKKTRRKAFLRGS